MQTTPDFTWLFIKMVIGLTLVIGLALFLFRFVLPKTRFSRFRGGVPWASLEDAVRLDHTKSLYLVKILERYFVLGASEHALNVITELSHDEGEKISGGRS
ncbi:MAG TPA: flagellar biosynthetic protein FliO [bacterium]|nr:flagellar biosynthetic protein FliO [bacterium]